MYLYPFQGRVPQLDVLRGMAVLGILLMNVQAFAMPFAAYTNPTAWGSLRGVDGLVWLVSHLLTDHKFMSLFAVLFGAGVVLMAERASAAGSSPALVHYRRMAGLAVMGLLHAYLLWPFDILFPYALAGAVVYPLRRLGVPWLLLLAGLCLAVVSFWLLVGGVAYQHWADPAMRQELVGTWSPMPQAMAAEVADYRGSWLRQMNQRVPMALQLQAPELALYIWRIIAMMLLGMALYKLGVLTGRRGPRTAAALLWVGLMVGLPLSAAGVVYNFACGWALPEAVFFGYQFNYWGSVATMLGWIGIGLMMTRLWRPAWLVGALAATGRMALTNYLMQTVICTAIFYGHGLGLFGQVGRAGQFGVVLVLWALQLTWSASWLRVYRFGPIEWLWRWATYGKRP